MRNPKKSNPSSRWQTRVFSSERRNPISLRTLLTSSWSPSASSRVPATITTKSPAYRTNSHKWSASTASLGSSPLGTERLPLACEVLVQSRECDVGEQWRKNATLGCAGVRVPTNRTLREDAGSKKRLEQRQHAFASDPTTYLVHPGHVVDLVKARFDIRLEHPQVIPGR